MSRRPEGLRPRDAPRRGDGAAVCSAGCNVDEALLRDVYALPERGEGDAHPEVEESPAAALRFLTIEELRGLAPPSVEWVWDGYLAPGNVTLLGGKPKVGKSTLVGDLPTASATGAGSFLGRAVRRGPVVYVAEEGISTLLDKLPDHPDLRVLTRETAWPKPTWPALVEAATAEALALGAWVVFDTWGYWAGLGPDAEKDAGATLKAVAALNRATRAGLAVVLVHHQRKAGGSDGDAFRGSNALTGAVDALVEIERPGEDSPPGHRQIVAVSRFRDVTPPLLLVDRAPDGSWKVMGEGGGREEAVSLGWRGRILEAVPATAEGATTADLIGVLGEGKRHWSPVLRDLVDDGLVEKEGKGQKGSPFRYRRPLEEAPEKAVPQCWAPGGPERDRNAEEDAFSVPVPEPVGGGGTETHLGTKDAVPVREGDQQSLNGAVRLGEPSGGCLGPPIADYFAPSTDGEPPVDLDAWERALAAEPPPTLADALGSEEEAVAALVLAFDAVELPADDPRALAFAEEAASW